MGLIAAHAITEWVGRTCRALVPHPEAIVIREVTGYRSLIIEVWPGVERNIGFLIGHEGEVARALRILAGRMGSRLPVQYDVTTVVVSELVDDRTRREVIPDATH